MTKIGSTRPVDSTMFILPCVKPASKIVCLLDCDWKCRVRAMTGSNQHSKFQFILEIVEIKCHLMKFTPVNPTVIIIVIIISITIIITWCVLTRWPGREKLTIVCNWTVIHAGELAAFFLTEEATHCMLWSMDLAKTVKLTLAEGG